MSPQPHVVILGAGPAGLGAAYRLARRHVAVTVLERQPVVGGNAGSFTLAGQRVDYGSHRLHPSCDPQVLADIRALLGDDLLDRPRHGRIRLQGRWIHFPLQPVDLALRLPPRFTAGVALDTARKLVPHHNGHTADNFATALEASLGPTICRDFYFPYARKIWGRAPEELSVVQAQRRVSANSVGKLARRVLAAAPGQQPQGKRRFFYPRQGYGQISEAYADAATTAGARLELSASVASVARVAMGGYEVRYTREGQPQALKADYVWSTIPVTALAQLLEPPPPAELLAASRALDYRAMLLVYLVLAQPQFTEYDAHYFPGADIPITRLSEPKNYSLEGLAQSTVLCAELPCDPNGPEWQMSDNELGDLVRDGLTRAGLPIRAPILQVVTRRLRYAYPIYGQGYEAHFERLDGWLSQQPRLLSFGRQGLFAHDNTHHALYMAYCAANCLADDGAFDTRRWQAYRHEFQTHVVED